jgi:hypothetical protein
MDVVGLGLRLRLGMVAIGLTLMLAARVSPGGAAAKNPAALGLCIVGLLGLFAVGYPGYFVFDAIWPSYYYSLVVAGKNAWLLGQALLIAVYYAGVVMAFGDFRRALRPETQPTLVENNDEQDAVCGSCSVLSRQFSF